MSPSSGETTVFMQNLVLVILCAWLSAVQGGNIENDFSVLFIILQRSKTNADACQNILHTPHNHC
jgi:hypothetical protein